MEEKIVRSDQGSEFYTDEGCFILELSNCAEDEAASIARARVEPGVATQRHRLRGVAERYLVLKGKGRMEMGDLPPAEVGPGDVVLIPPGCPQRITNIGDDDLLFLAVCTPRFTPDTYEEAEETPRQ
ncbi:MAG: cupin domain-containing protein [Deltaproteobacteria bacterium]|nr:cupin domain-containing protein [Deltaproteobacteria bacterium]MBW2674116.1 cupin domain-containing protein [Deltaproteobacteria bacterium]